MESQDQNPNQTNGTLDESQNVDRIRNILFGSQMRDYDGRFQRLEERLVRDAAEVRSDLQKRLEALEAFMKGEVESLPTGSGGKTRSGPRLWASSPLISERRREALN